LETDVAKHLSENYGDRAWTVCSLAQPTGKAWPLHGERLAPQYPCTFFSHTLLTNHIYTYIHLLVLDAEVRYAIRNEYAVSAIDVLARRTRLSFLNARAALDALPRVVEIMAEELHWSYPERQRQIENTVKFLESMGLNAPFSITPAPIPRGFVEKAREEVKRVGLWVLGYGHASDITIESFGPGRSRFEAGEVAALRMAFSGRARVSVPDAVGVDGDVVELKVPMEEVMDILRSVPGYPEISKKELNYVVAEAGMDGQKEVDLDEFIEVRLLFFCHYRLP